MRIRVLVVGLLATAAVVGCGSKGGPVEGTVVNGGKAYNPATEGDLNIRLSAAGGKTYTGSVAADGSFKVTDLDGVGGVPPGKYKVGFTKYPTKENIKPGTPPAVVNKDLAEEWDVAAGQKYTLDIAKAK